MIKTNNVQKYDQNQQDRKTQRQVIKIKEFKIHQNASKERSFPKCEMEGLRLWPIIDYWDLDILEQ